MSESLPQSLHCPTCDYNLTGLPENRCPECGTQYDPDVLREAMIRRKTRSFYLWIILEPILFVIVLGRLLAGEADVAGQAYFVVAMVINAFLVAVKLDTLLAHSRHATPFILVTCVASIILLQYAIFAAIGSFFPRFS